MSHNKALIDDDREINFVVVGSVRRGTIDVYRLTWQGRIIPLSASWRQRGEDDNILGYDVVVFDFNDGRVSHDYDIPMFTFSSHQERAEGERIAVECLLAFGQTMDGLDAPPGFYRFPRNGRERTLQAFGY
jgi:hypothetical protein